MYFSVYPESKPTSYYLGQLYTSPTKIFNDIESAKTHIDNFLKRIDKIMLFS